MVIVDNQNPITRQCKFNKVYKDYVYDVCPDLLLLEKKHSEIRSLKLKYYFRINQRRITINPRLAVAYEKSTGHMVNVIDLALIFNSK